MDYARRVGPIPGSVIATAVIRLPSTMPGSQRSFCSSVQYSRSREADIAGARVTPSTAPVALVIALPPTIWLMEVLQSGPPYSSETDIASMFFSPASRKSFARDDCRPPHRSKFGMISSVTKRPTVSRKS